MSAETNWHFVFCADLFKSTNRFCTLFLALNLKPLDFMVLHGSCLDDSRHFGLLISGLMQPSSTQNWLSSQGSSSGLIVKREIGVDIPIDKYPNSGSKYGMPFSDQRPRKHQGSKKGNGE
ncbi:hypothetical protein QYF36_019809 [Acer negundo]|nr:hypothetical protein QYF36_019809 [Acer negundo]